MELTAVECAKFLAGARSRCWVSGPVSPVAAAAASEVLHPGTSNRPVRRGRCFSTMPARAGQYEAKNARYPFTNARRFLDFWRCGCKESKGGGARTGTSLTVTGVGGTLGVGRRRGPNRRRVSCGRENKIEAPMEMEMEGEEAGIGTETVNEQGSSAAAPRRPRTAGPPTQPETTATTATMPPPGDAEKARAYAG